MQKVKSYSKGKDCFGNEGKSTVDHIFPKNVKSKSGLPVAKGKINQQLLTEKSNGAKGNKLKGIIGKWEFVIVEQTSKEQQVYGRMRIRKIGNIDWIQVIPV